MALDPTVTLHPALATFLVLHRTGFISAASAELHLSQPAVTRRLQTLERQMGAALFDRTTAGLLLTSAGHALLPHAERAVAAELDGLRAVSDHLAGSVGQVTICVVGSLAERWLSDVFVAVAQDMPGVDLVVSTATSRQTRDQVIRGDIAIGISYARPTDPELEVMVVFHETLLVVGAPSHPAANKAVMLDDLRNERWLLFPELPRQPESSGTIARNLLDRHQVASDRIRPIDSLSAQRALARAGYGLAFLPESAVVDDVAAGELAVIDVVDARVVTPVTAITRRAAYRSPATAMVLHHLARTTINSTRMKTTPGISPRGGAR